MRMKLRRIFPAVFASIVSLSIFVVPVSALSSDPAKMAARDVFNEETAVKLSSLIKSKLKVTDIKAPKLQKDIILSAASAPADYPTRKGMILITGDFYKGLIPTGHAAIVYSASQVIESVSNGVVMGKNDWWSSKNSSAAGSVSSTTTAQDAASAEWCKGKLGKPYNYNYFDTKTRSYFYCSQLVWASFLDNFNVDLNTSAYSIYGLGNPIHPLELLSNNLTYISYKHNW